MDPASLQARLPPGLTLDTWKDRAYLGIVPFQMRRVHPRRLCPVPGISDFLELNVRTYVHDAQGVPGVWFFSLDANQPLAVAVARRWFHLNYQHATMSLSVKEDSVHYHCLRRRVTSIAAYRYPAHISGHTAPLDTLDFFLLERYYLYAWNHRKSLLYRGQVSHSPYRYQTLPLPGTWSALPATWEGLSPEGPPIHIAAAEEVAVRAYTIQPVS